MTKKKIPDRWHNYTNVGSRVKGTRFLPFKVPLKEEVCKQRIANSDWFTPAILLESRPNLKLIIDLTNTDRNRYYNCNDFLDKGVDVVKIKCPGGPNQVPNYSLVKKFCNIVKEFMIQSSEDSLIGVHCTHGLNRTGYFICKYMVECLNVSPCNAFHDFEYARGHLIERHLYKKDIVKGVKAQKIQPIKHKAIQYQSPLEDSDYQSNSKLRYGCKRKHPIK